ncbi:MAG: hypothetical protein AB1921_18005 [Thermodesulfobacteriota bacterium]
MMKEKEFLVPQLSVFIENRLSSLAKLTRCIANRNINLRGFSLAESREFGAARIIVSDVVSCREVLQAAGYHFVETDVLAVAVSDRPGGMADVLEGLAAEQVNVEYAYAMIDKHLESAIIILRVPDPLKVVMILRKTNVRLLTWKDVTLL